MCGAETHTLTLPLGLRPLSTLNPETVDPLSQPSALPQALMVSAPPDDLYRSKGIVPLSTADADAERARGNASTLAQAPPAEAAAAAAAAAASAGAGADVEWWLFNGVAGRLTLEPLASSNGPASLVFMGRDFKRRLRAIGLALALLVVAVVDANVAKPEFAIGGGVARGLCVACDPSSE